MQEQKKNIKQIDLTEIIKKLWVHRKKFYYVVPTTLIVTYLFMMCIPRYYSCTVSLAPEPTGASMSSSLSSLASSFGVGSLAKMASKDAISAEIYPDVISSKDFIANLMTVGVATQDGEVKCNYYTYLRDHQKAAWWDVIRGTVSEWISPTPKDQATGEEKLSVFHLTKIQDDIFNAAQGKVKCSVDKKTDVVSITMKDQDPLVCATMANATCKKLQEFIITYRTNKARIDYQYYKNLCEKSKAEYDKARQVYASYADAHQNTVLISYTAKAEELENEMQLRHNVYNAINNQMQASQAKLQEATPAFTIIQSASVPVKPDGPKRMFIALVCAFISFIATGIYVYTKGV